MFGHLRPRLVEADDTVYAQAFARRKILVRLSAPVLGHRTVPRLTQTMRMPVGIGRAGSVLSVLSQVGVATHS